MARPYSGVGNVFRIFLDNSSTHVTSHLAPRCKGYFCSFILHTSGRSHCFQKNLLSLSHASVHNRLILS